MENLFRKLVTSAVIFYLVIGLSGCTSQHIVTVWETPHPFPINYKRILVVAILPDEDSTVRDNIERNFTNALADLGYQVVSAVHEFGRKGLSNLGEDETYIKLASNGFDAVVTIALVNRTKETEHLPAASHSSRNNFFYKRIFDYKSTLTQPGTNSATEQYFWESILFDLSRLEATTAVQTPSSSKTTQLKMSNDLAKQMIDKMKEEKALKKQKNLPKAF